VLALVAAAGLLIVYLASARKGSAEKPFDVAFSVACTAAVVAVALHAMWDFSLRIPGVASVAVMVIGIAPTALTPPSGNLDGAIQIRS
jgi:hypothetical protein